VHDIRRLDFQDDRIAFGEMRPRRRRGESSEDTAAAA